MTSESLNELFDEMRTIANENGKVFQLFNNLSLSVESLLGSNEKLSKRVDELEKKIEKTQNSISDPKRRGNESGRKPNLGIDCYSKLTKNK